MSAEEAKRLNILPPGGNISKTSSLNRSQGNRSITAPPVAVVQGKQVAVQNLSNQSRWVTIHCMFYVDYVSCMKIKSYYKISICNITHQRFCGSNIRNH